MGHGSGSAPSATDKAPPPDGALLDVLEIRFELAASDPLAARLGAIDDVPRLKQLFRAAIQMPSLEAFSHLLEAANRGCV